MPTCKMSSFEEFFLFVSKDLTVTARLKKNKSTIYAHTVAINISILIFLPYSVMETDLSPVKGQTNIKAIY